MSRRRKSCNTNPCQLRHLIPQNSYNFPHPVVVKNSVKKFLDMDHDPYPGIFWLNFLAGVCDLQVLLDVNKFKLQNQCTPSVKLSSKNMVTGCKNSSLCEHISTEIWQEFGRDLVSWDPCNLSTYPHWHLKEMVSILLSIQTVKVLFAFIWTVSYNNCP